MDLEPRDAQDNTPLLSNQYFTAWGITIVTFWGTFLASLDASLVDVCLVTIAKDFNVELELGIWVLIIYALTEAACLPMMGRLGDRFSKKKVYQTGMMIFLVGSIACSLALNIYMLFAARVIQGMGCAMLSSMALAIVGEFTKPEQATQGISNLMIVSGVGLSAGPSLGALLTAQFGWRSAFWLNVPIGVVGLLFVQRALPVTPPNPKVGFDVLGALLFFCCTSSFLLGVTLIPDAQQVTLAIFFIAALVLGCALVVWLNVYPTPLIPLRLLTKPATIFSLLTGFLLYMSVPIIRFLLPVYLQNGLGWPLEDVGLFMLTQPITYSITAPIPTFLYARVPIRFLTAAASLGMVGCGFVIAFSIPSLVITIGATIAFALATQVFYVPNVRYLLSWADQEDMGITSALNSITKAGAPIGIAIMTVLLDELVEKDLAIADREERYTTAVRTIILFIVGIPQIFSAILTVFRPSVATRVQVAVERQIEISQHSCATRI